MYVVYKTNYCYAVNEDFANTSVILRLTPSEPRQCSNISIIDDDVLEVVEYFSASINVVGDLPPATSLNITQATVQIFLDNESGCDIINYVHTF